VYSHLGTSHQATEDIACTRAIPNLTILSPADRFEMTATMHLALSLKSPVYLRMGKSDCGDVHSGPVDLCDDKLLPVKSGQHRIALIATGSMVRTAIEITEQGMDASVWSAPSIKPLNAEQLLAIATNVDAIITLEEHSVMGGLGACVAEIVSAQCPVPICRIGVEDKFSISCGTWTYLLEEHGLDFQSVKQRIDTFMDTVKASENKF
jgi:transketolase